MHRFSHVRISINWGLTQNGTARPARQNDLCALITPQPLDRFWWNKNHFIAWKRNFWSVCVPLSYVERGPHNFEHTNTSKSRFFSNNCLKFLANKRSIYSILCRILRSFWCNCQKFHFRVCHMCFGRKCHFLTIFSP